MNIKKIFSSILSACMLLLMMTSCQNNTLDNSSEGNSNTGISDSSGFYVSDPYSSVPNESNEPDGSYFTHTNFVKKKTSEDGSDSYVPILGEIIYNGGELDIYVEVEFSGDYDIEKMNALALFFVDGYIQEFSLDDDEKALVHNATVPNNKVAYYNYKCAPATYDNDTGEHTMVAVILVYWQFEIGNFVRDTVPVDVSRKIKLNTVNKPENDNVVQMNNRKKTGWDGEHSELPFKQGEADTEVTFHCFNEGETCCYVFCGGELFSPDGKYIFESVNSDRETVSFQSISVDKSDVGKPLYVLYVPKGEYPMIERTCNHLWRKL